MLLKLSVQSWPQCSNRDALGTAKLALRLLASPGTFDFDGGQGRRRMHTALSLYPQAGQDASDDLPPLRTVEAPSDLSPASSTLQEPPAHDAGSSTAGLFNDAQGRLLRNVAARATPMDFVSARPPPPTQPPASANHGGAGHPQSSALGRFAAAVWALVKAAIRADAAQESVTLERLSQQAAREVLAAPLAALRPGLSWGPRRMVGDGGLNALVGGVLVHQTRSASSDHCGQVRDTRHRACDFGIVACCCALGFQRLCLSIRYEMGSARLVAVFLSGVLWCCSVACSPVG